MTRKSFMSEDSLYKLYQQYQHVNTNLCVFKVTGFINFKKAFLLAIKIYLLNIITKFGGSPLIFLRWLKLAISNLVYSLGLPRPIIKSHLEKTKRGSGLWKLPKIWGSTNISASAEASDLKVSKRLKFFKAYHKYHPPRKKWGEPGLGELPKI